MKKKLGDKLSYPFQSKMQQHFSSPSRCKILLLIFYNSNSKTVIINTFNFTRKLGHREFNRQSEIYTRESTQGNCPSSFLYLKLPLFPKVMSLNPVKSINPTTQYCITSHWMYNYFSSIFMLKVTLVCSTLSDIKLLSFKWERTIQLGQLEVAP